MPRNRPDRLPPTSEDELLVQVLQLARLRGWRTAHFRPARVGQGWRTAVQGDGKGWPDLVLVRVVGSAGRIIMAELKRDDGTLTFDQQVWADLLARIGGPVEYYVWRPSDWKAIEKTLERGV